MTDTTQRKKGNEQLTDRTIQAWLRTDSALLHDGSGLYLRRRVDGAYWALRQVNASSGKRTWAGLMPGIKYPEATLASARRKAIDARLRAADRPTDVVRERQAALGAMKEAEQAAKLEAQRRLTVRQLFERWAKTELQPNKRADGKRTGRKDAGQSTRELFERRVFPQLGEAAAAAISTADVLAIIDAAKAEKKLRTANVLLTDLKQMMRFAVKREIIARNPLETLTKQDAGGAEAGRDRTLTLDEVKLLAHRLPASGLSSRSALAVWLILATGCRVGELMTARWMYVDLVAATWHLPDTKNERPHTIHLSPFAIGLLTVLANLSESADWLFPSAAGDAAVCVKSFGKQLADRQRSADRRLRQRSHATEALVLPGGRWTAHDLRRTAATHMARLGVSGDTIDECLNHKIESRVRRTYVRDRRLPEQARAFDELGLMLQEIWDEAAKG